MVLAMLNTKKRLMRNADPFCKLRVGQIAPRFSQIFRQLLVQIALHI